FAENGDYWEDHSRHYNESKSGYIRIDSIYTDSSRLQFTVNGTMGFVELDKPLMPGSLLIMHIDFVNKIPFPYLREGTLNGRYDISQWYPKVAVYKNGRWADFQVSKYTEFFGEYGDYTVSVTLPGNYYVFGTGSMDDSMRSELLSDLDGDNYYENTQSDSFRTITLRARNVNDFAFIARNEFYYFYDNEEKPAVEMICSSKGRDTYAESIDETREIIQFYSEKYIEYPYDRITVAEGLVRAGGGMEYPCFIIVSSMMQPNRMQIPFVDMKVFRQVLCHEIAHQWFYLIIGSNEAEEPFMDEAFAVYSELSYMEHAYGENNYISLFGRKLISLFDNYYFSYRFIQSNGLSAPMDFSSYDYEDDYSYGINVYSKGMLVLRAMEAMIGREQFTVMMQEYFDTFAFTHPSISDFESFINSYTDNKYSRNIKHLLHENVYNDYSISGIEKKDNVYEISIGNESPFEFEVPVEIIYSDGSSDTIFTSDKLLVKVDKNKKLSNIIIDPDMRFLDTDYYNNIRNKYTEIHFSDYSIAHFSNNIYFHPMMQHSLIDKFSYGIGIYACDIPTFEFNRHSMFGNWALKIFAGYNPVTAYQYQHEFIRNQGEQVITQLIHRFKYTPLYFETYNGVRAVRHAEDYDYEFKLLGHYRRTGTLPHFSDKIFTGKLSRLLISMNYFSKESFYSFYIYPIVEISDPIIYSSTEYQKLDIKGGLSVPAGKVSVSLNIDGGFILGDINVENSYYLKSSELTLFRERSASLGNYGFGLGYNNGMGYITDNDNLHKSIEKLSLEAGNSILKAYFSNYFASVDYSQWDYYYQTGIKLRFGRVLTIDLPVYNDSEGLLLSKSLGIYLSSEIIQ
ncbi:MAG: M1 family metallopeptidase, partial [candidate division WOR-3 bacterium]|nr:M1 family metallopeptidase [candidate division WOR-3 bacterium]